MAYYSDQQNCCTQLVTWILTTYSRFAVVGFLRRGQRFVVKHSDAYLPLTTCPMLALISGKAIYRTLTETTTFKSLSANLTSSTLNAPPPDISIDPFLIEDPAETFIERTTSEIFVTNLAEYVTVYSRLAAV